MTSLTSVTSNHESRHCAMWWLPSFKLTFTSNPICCCGGECERTCFMLDLRIIDCIVLEERRRVLRLWLMVPCMSLVPGFPVHPGYRLLFALLDHVTVTFIHFLRSFLFAPVLFYIRSCWLLFLLYFCIMVNQCCLPYCKSGANGFKFPNAENHPELREKWIKFVSQVNFEPSEHTRICIEHFEERYIKFGKGHHLRWESLPIPTVHTNEKYDKNVSPSSLSMPKKTTRSSSDFDSLSEADCLPGFTLLSRKTIS